MKAMLGESDHSQNVPKESIPLGAEERKLVEQISADRQSRVAKLLCRLISTPLMVV